MRKNVFGRGFFSPDGSDILLPACFALRAGKRFSGQQEIASEKK